MTSRTQQTFNLFLSLTLHIAIREADIVGYHDRLKTTLQRG